MLAKDTICGPQRDETESHDQSCSKCLANTKIPKESLKKGEGCKDPEPKKPQERDEGRIKKRKGARGFDP